MPAGKTPARIAFDDLPAGLSELLSPRVDRLGYLGEFFQCAAHQPEALTHFIGFTEALKAALPFRLVETIALTVAAQTDNAYERVQHERLALANGFTVDEVSHLTAGQAASCPALSPAEVAVASLARCVVKNLGHRCESALLEVQRLEGDGVAVGCLMLAARYLAHAAMANAWRLDAPVESPLEQAAARG